MHIPLAFLDHAATDHLAKEVRNALRARPSSSRDRSKDCQTSASFLHPVYFPGGTSVMAKTATFLFSGKVILRTCLVGSRENE
jgi:hypothetical protein